MADQAEAYSIEIRDRSTEQITIFTFIDVTGEEMQIVLAQFRRLLTGTAGDVVFNLPAPLLNPAD